MRRLDVDGHTILIDSEDVPLISGFHWRVVATNPTCPDNLYAVTCRRRLYVYMHRLIAGAGPSEEVDHANGNGLDNRKNNLRIATDSQNQANKGKIRVKGKRGTSQYKGVFWDKARSAWATSITVNKRTRHLGRFSTEEEAARAYDRAAIAAWGEFARLNFEEGVAA
jgi:hypothetical protein